MIVIINLFRNAVMGDEIHQDIFCEGDWTACTKINRNASVYAGRFYPVSNESMDFKTDRITGFDGRQSNRTIDMDVFLN